MKFIRFLPYFSFSYLSLLIITFFVYTLAGKFGLSLAYLNASVSAIWPPTGIALAVFIMLGYRMWPAIFLGAFVVNLTTQGSIATSFGIAFGNMLEGIIGCYLINTFASGQQTFEHVQDVFKFSLIVLFATTISATIGVVTLILGAYASWQNFGPVWLTWWLGDVGGGLIVGPFLLLWLSSVLRIRFSFDIKRLIDAIFFFLVVIVTGELIFLGIMPYPYLCIPVLVWGAFRFGQKEEATAVLLFALIAIWDSLHGFGPYSQQAVGLNQSLLLIALFLSIIAITMMTITAALLERKRAKYVLDEREQRFQALIEKSFDSIILINPISKILYASPSVKRLLGYTPEELIGKIGLDLVDPLDRARITHELSKLVVHPGSTVTVEYRTMQKNGQIIWVEATGTNLLTEQSVQAVVVNFRDITERKITQESIAYEKIADEALIASIGEGIIATDEKGIITKINDTACRLLGWSENQLIGKLVWQIIPMKDESGKVVPQEARPITKVFKLGKTIITSPSKFYVRKDGSSFPVIFTLSPIILSNKVIGTIEVFRDITFEKEIDNAKTEFVSLASHQLRTPLTTINWYLERLLAGEVKKSGLEEKRYLKTVYEASQRMVDLINTILNVSRLELGTFAIEPVEINLLDIIKKMLTEFKPQIEDKKIIVKEKLDKHIPQILADPKLIRIIFQNLLANAIKYTNPDGTITIELSFDKQTQVIKITDTGIGIPKKEESKIFTKMLRANNAKLIAPDGTGLGLYIVKLIVDKIGATIGFASVENKGTTFYVSFPASGMKKNESTNHIY